jgi:hypothetical protein
VQLRTSAAEAIAFLFEARWTLVDVDEPSDAALDAVTHCVQCGMQRAT